MKPSLVVLAAGMGNRYGGVKQIEAVGRYNETLLDYATFDAKKCGYGGVVYIIRRDIEKAFRERVFDRIAKNFNAVYVFQSRENLLTDAQAEASKNRTKPWGTIHALLCAKEAVKEPFTVINADDYYGRAAFETMCDYLSGIPNDCSEHAMVSYVLKNTLSKTGAVSRGVCSVKNGCLVSMEEHTKIAYEDNKIVSSKEDGKIILTGDEPVSMNFFGFLPAVFKEFGVFFEEFIKNNVKNESAEALLPAGVNRIVLQGRGKLKVFTSKEMWFGMTYPDDRAAVHAEIAKKIETGYYPEKLWEYE
jgi:NDP-sugar pyrophosphorylase family protein